MPSESVNMPSICAAVIFELLLLVKTEGLENNNFSEKQNRSAEQFPSAGTHEPMFLLTVLETPVRVFIFILLLKALKKNTVDFLPFLCSQFSLVSAREKTCCLSFPTS